MLKYLELKAKPKEFLCATGLTDDEFQSLLPSFDQAFLARPVTTPKARRKKRKRQAGGGRKGQLAGRAEQWLFMLVYQKTAPLQTMHGLQFGLSQPQTNYWIHRLLPLLQASLRALGLAPERVGSAVATTPRALTGGANLSLDGTERRLQRPVNTTQQKEKYSGKKRTHTDKNLVLGNENTTEVVYLSPTVDGKKHDKKLADESQLSYPPNATLTQDTGFQGYAPEGVLTLQPKKNSRPGLERGRAVAQPRDCQRTHRD